VVPLDGLEPPARGLGNRCSIHLSYRGMSQIVHGLWLKDAEYATANAAPSFASSPLEPPRLPNLCKTSKYAVAGPMPRSEVSLARPVPAWRPTPVVVLQFLLAVLLSPRRRLHNRRVRWSQSSLKGQ
jgi:hypothetical protein